MKKQTLDFIILDIKYFHENIDFIEMFVNRIEIEIYFGFKYYEKKFDYIIFH
jgi:hypothetical protein